MKKTNFLVVFWLLIGIISFVTLLIFATSIFRNVAYIIIPDQEYYQNRISVQRSLLTAVPMLIISIVAFYLSLRQGLKTYKQN